MHFAGDGEAQLKPDILERIDIFHVLVGRLNMQKSIVSFHRKVSIRGWRFYEDCRFPFSKIPLGTVWFLAKTVLFFPRHVLLQLEV